MIEVSDLVKVYGPTRAVDGISFKIESGEVVGLLGPNGAGKSTTIRILATYLAPNMGTASVAGFDVTADPLEVRRRLGYLPEQAPSYEEMRVKDYLNFIMQARAVPSPERPAAFEKVVASVGIGSVLKKSIRELSKGYRQRVGLAQAMVHDPEILILDEPTSGLDPNQIIEIRKLIREIGKEKTVVLSTHILAEVEATCDRVIIIHRGRIAADGKISELRRSGAEEGLYTVRSAEDREKVVEAIGSIEGVSAVEPTGDGSDFFDPLFRVRAKRGDVHLGEEIFTAARDAGIKLSEVAAVHRTLEDIFQDLTEDN
ncbi:MAG: ATP-binding cassette domain-containing protein [Planctomycetota bacterium]|jgi:ABC-2 type transport system ATP-binding protein